MMFPLKTSGFLARRDSTIATASLVVGALIHHRRCQGRHTPRNDANESAIIEVMIERPKSTSRRACVALAASTLFAFLPARSQPTDADFAAARDAYRAGDAARLELLAPRLKGHLLEPYVAYWQLTLSLDQAEPAAVTAFLARNADSPLDERLRVEWL